MKRVLVLLFNFLLINCSFELTIPDDLNENANKFVVNGIPANIADFPWHLGLIDLDLGGNICGASNIS